MFDLMSFYFYQIKIWKFEQPKKSILLELTNKIMIKEIETTSIWIYNLYKFTLHPDTKIIITDYYNDINLLIC